MTAAGRTYQPFIPPHAVNTQGGHTHTNTHTHACTHRNTRRALDNGNECGHDVSELRANIGGRDGGGEARKVLLRDALRGLLQAGDQQRLNVRGDVAEPAQPQADAHKGALPRCVVSFLGDRAHKTAHHGGRQGAL